MRKMKELFVDWVITNTNKNEWKHFRLNKSPVLSNVLEMVLIWQILSLYKVLFQNFLNVSYTITMQEPKNGIYRDCLKI